MDTIARLTTADWRGGAGVDTKFETKDGAANAFVIKAIPVFMDRVGKGGAQIVRKVRGDCDVFIELGLVAVGVPEVNIGPGRYSFGSRSSGKGFAVTLENKNAVVDFSTVVEWLIVVAGFGTPDFWGMLMMKDVAEDWVEKVGSRGVVG